MILILDLHASVQMLFYAYDAICVTMFVVGEHGGGLVYHYNGQPLAPPTILPMAEATGGFIPRLGSARNKELVQGLMIILSLINKYHSHLLEDGAQAEDCLRQQH